MSRVSGGGRANKAKSASLVALFVLLCASLLPLPLALAAPQSDETSDPVLYLRGERDAPGRYNFTAEPPQAQVPRSVDPFDVHTARNAEWTWRMDRAPVPWTLPAGTEVTLVVHFDELHDTLPLPTVPPRVDDPVGLRVEARLLRGGTHDVVAHGSAPLDHGILDGPGPTSITLTLHVPTDATYGTTPGSAPSIGLHIELHGLTRQDAPPTILTGATTASSHVRIPTFPMMAYQEWERAERDGGACLQLLLDQRACNEEEHGPLGRSEAQEAPPIGVLAAILVAAAAAGIFLQPRRARR